MDGHTDSQHETIIPPYYRVVGYKDGYDLYNFYSKNIFGFFFIKKYALLFFIHFKGLLLHTDFVENLHPNYKPYRFLYSLHLILLWEKMKKLMF